MKIHEKLMELFKDWVARRDGIIQQKTGFIQVVIGRRRYRFHDHPNAQTKVFAAQFFEYIHQDHWHLSSYCAISEAEIDSGKIVRSPNRKPRKSKNEY